MITKHNVFARNISVGDIVESFGTTQRVYAIGKFPSSKLRFHLEEVENSSSVTDLTVPEDYVLVVQIPRGF